MHWLGHRIMEWARENWLLVVGSWAMAVVKQRGQPGPTPLERRQSHGFFYFSSRHALEEAQGDHKRPATGLTDSQRILSRPPLKICALNCLDFPLAVIQLPRSLSANFSSTSKSSLPFHPHCTSTCRKTPTRLPDGIPTSLLQAPPAQARARMLNSSSIQAPSHYDTLTSRKLSRRRNCMRTMTRNGRPISWTRIRQGPLRIASLLFYRAKGGVCAAGC